MKYNTSYWEIQSFLKPTDYLVLGAGITGVSAAIELKTRFPKKEVVLVDRNTFPLGASTRNAGFACFGSVTELLDDLEKNDEASVLELMNKRFTGLNILRERLGDEKIDYQATGSYEVFKKDDLQIGKYRDAVSWLNEKIENRIGLKESFKIKDNLPAPFPGFSDFNIVNSFEGIIHPGKMMFELFALAQRLNCRFLMGTNILEIRKLKNSVILSAENFELETEHLIICTNGFSQQLLPEFNVKPARNQVLLTEEIPGLNWKGAFHFDKGYTYFRNVGNRVLIGGGRNLFSLQEETEKFDLSQEVEEYLYTFLSERLGLKSSVSIEQKWSGILGIGDTKEPIIKKIDDHIILAIRMGGMGVALASFVAKEAINMLNS